MDLEDRRTLLCTPWLITPLISHGPVPLRGQAYAPSPQAILNGHTRLRSYGTCERNRRGQGLSELLHSRTETGSRGEEKHLTFRTNVL